MNNKRRLTILIWLIAALLVSCQPPVPPSETPTDTPPPAITPLPDVTVCAQVSEPKNNQATNEFFIDKQVIVIGPREDVDAVIGRHDDSGTPIGPGAAQLTLDLIQNCDLSFLGNLGLTDQRPYEPLAEGKQPSAPPFSQTNYESLVMRLYEIPAEESITVDAAIEQIRNAAGDQYAVFADPNYLVDLWGSGSCGDPYSGGGSPYSGGGSPYAGPGIPDPNATPPIRSQFMTQWALGQKPGGIVLPSPRPFTGGGVRVAVFDTAPFGLKSPSTITPTPPPVPVRSPFPAQPTDLPLLVSDAIIHPLASINPPAGDLSDHGLFVAGLVHAVAPDSEIHLIRVLNDDGCGALNTINTGLVTFIFRMITAYGSLNKTVINLSFGIHVPAPAVQEQHPEITWKDVLDLMTFRTAITAAHGSGAILVAAAGNDAATAMSVPANYDIVVGVAATNDQGQLSCYSNPGDLAAPGGDGGQSSNSNCAALTGSMSAGVPSSQQPCNDFAQCPYGLISLSQSVTGGPGYIFWAGTSFSAPLVSGLAALAYEKSGNRDKGYCLVTTGTQQGNRSVSNVRFGLIDIDFNLTKATCP